MKRWLLVLGGLAFVLVGCSGGPATPAASLVPTTSIAMATSPTPTTPRSSASATPLRSGPGGTVPGSTPPHTAPPGTDPVLVGGGDIAACDTLGDEATSALLDGIEGTVFTLGDNVYPDGTAAEFARCYDPSWGRYKARTRPAAGNHEYHTPGASGYYAYFGAAAGDPSKGYYSYDLGGWHIVVVNSNCGEVGGCQAGSPQERWLRADLAAHPAICTLAYWHHPRFSSGSEHGSAPEIGPIWQALYEAGAEIVLSGHEHNYERFAPQDPAGRADPARGIRQFVVGTGGRSHYSVKTPIANSEVRDDDTFGVLKLTLHPTSYNWEFVPIVGMTFTDSGSARCHRSGLHPMKRTTMTALLVPGVPPMPEPTPAVLFVNAHSGRGAGRTVGPGSCSSRWGFSSAWPWRKRS